MINGIIGVLSVGALTAQAIAMVRGEKKSVLYGYGMAVIRLPQLLLWAILSLVVGSIIQAIEQQKANRITHWSTTGCRMGCPDIFLNYEHNGNWMWAICFNYKF